MGAANHKRRVLEERCTCMHSAIYIHPETYVSKMHVLYSPTESPLNEDVLGEEHAFIDTMTMQARWLRLLGRTGEYFGVGVDDDHLSWKGIRIDWYYKR